MGRVSKNSENFADSFQTLMMAFELTWPFVQFILVSCTAAERNRIIKGAKQVNDETFAVSPPDNQ